MKQRILSTFFVLMYLATLGLSAAYAAGAAPRSNSDLKSAFSSGRKTIVFFQNPMGGPCRAQNEILQKLHTDRGKKFNIVYIDASKEENQKVFYDYGVRGLPSLVAVDSSGNIGKVFAPGIQSYETLGQVLDSLK